ncbi:hypothetical protein N658DRAFT_507127 [Parathielavia hyrcaniae]|uniref:Uncharacterized protein n=1 Tax=Parathielavia hyrcaniae TaxID=113614 RepID=A0AAN6T1C6_9PEZI|nr:hypothetical protein N658DRAFT_507127 [Parathielavia hyrcaniae]
MSHDEKIMNTGERPPPPYTPNDMFQSQTPSPYVSPPIPYGPVESTLRPGFPPQPPQVQDMGPREQPTIQSRNHQLYQLQPPYQAVSNPQWPQSPTPPLCRHAYPISPPQPTAYHPPSHYQPPSPPHPPPSPITTTYMDMYTPIEYPYILTAKRQMTLLTPDRTFPFFTAIYPSSWSIRPILTVHSGGGDGPEVGGALFHNLTSGKVDAFLLVPSSGGGYEGRFDYRFRKKFCSYTGLGTTLGGSGGGSQDGREGKMMKWDVEGGAMVLRETGSEKHEYDEHQGGSRRCSYLARFSARDGGRKGVKGATERMEGRLEVWGAGLTALQLGEVFVTLVAEMERLRRDNEDWDIAGTVLGAVVGFV